MYTKDPAPLGRLVGARNSSALGVIVLGFLAITVAYPAIAMVRRFAASDVLVSGSSIVRIASFTFLQAVLSTVLTVVLALPLAHVVATYRFRFRSTVLAAVLVPFVLPTVVVAVAVKGLLARFGMEVDGISGSLVAILVAHIVFNVSVVVRMVGGYWASLDHRMLDAAAALGASPIRRFRRITLPLLRPAIMAAASIVFLFTFTSFGVIVILGGLSRATIETEIYRYAITRNDFGSAGLLAILQVGAVAIMAIANQRLQRGLGRGASDGVTNPAQTLPAGPQGVYAVGVVLATLLLLLAPLGALLLRSVIIDGSLGVEHYTALVDRPNVLPLSPLRALVNSVLFAAAAAVVAGIVGTVASLAVGAGGRLARWVEVAVLIPLGISAVTLGFGYLIGFTFFELRRSPILVVVAHSVIGIPFVVGAVLPAIRGLDPALLEVGSALGAPPVKVIRRVFSPLIRPAVVSGIGFAAAVSLGEFGASGFLARGRSSYTAPQAIFGLIGQPSAALQGQAAALCVLLACVIVVLVIAIDRIRGRTIGATGGWL